MKHRFTIIPLLLSALLLIGATSDCGSDKLNLNDNSTATPEEEKNASTLSGNIVSDDITSSPTDDASQSIMFSPYPDLSEEDLTRKIVNAEDIPKTTMHKKYNTLFLCGNLDKTTTSLIQWDINNVASYHPHGMNLVLRTQYDPSTNTFSCSQSMDNLYETYNYAQEKGLPTKMIRLSGTRYNFTYLNESLMPEWMAFYKQTLTELINTFDGENIPYICIMNELPKCYCNREYDDFTLECIELAKNAGYKVGISCGSLTEPYAMSQEVLDNLDFIGFNIYPRTEYKGNYTIYQDWLNAMNTYKAKLKSIRESTGKDIFITEIGICDSWECQSKISAYNKGTLSHGVLPTTFWKAFFESNISDECIGVSMWFWEASQKYDLVKETISAYINN